MFGLHFLDTKAKTNKIRIKFEVRAQSALS
jgi:hypothetical protein